MNKKNYTLALATVACCLASQSALANVDCDNRTEWDIQQVFTGGDQVQHKGHAYTAKWWTKSNKPQQNATNSVWGLDGSCLGSTSPIIEPPVIKIPEPTPTIPTPSPVTPPVDTIPPIDTNSGKSCGPYSKGKSFNAGDNVYTQDGSFQCLVGGWCSSASSDYQPGVGFANTLAWKPISQNLCAEPTPVPVTSETNPPGSPKGDKDPYFPDHALVGVWDNFLTYTSHTVSKECPKRLLDLADEWDIIMVNSASVKLLPNLDPTVYMDYESRTQGVLEFALYAGQAPIKYAPGQTPSQAYIDNLNSDRKSLHVLCEALDPDQFKQDIKTLKAQGKHVFLSVSKIAGFINNDIKSAEFLSSSSQIIDEWGFDGIDLNFDVSAHSHMINIIRTLHDNYNDQLFFTMNAQYSGLDKLRDIVDLTYLKQVNVNATSSSELIAIIRKLIDGAPNTDGSFFHGLRPDQIAIGISPNRDITFTTPKVSRYELNTNRARCLSEGGTEQMCNAFFTYFVSVDDITDAVNCISNGLNCGDAGEGNIYPSFNGVLIDAIAEEQYRNGRLIKPLSQLLDAL